MAKNATSNVNDNGSQKMLRFLPGLPGGNPGINFEGFEDSGLFYDTEGGYVFVRVGGSDVARFHSLTGMTALAGFIQQFLSMTYAASMTPNARQGNTFRVTVTDTNPFTINNPLNAQTGERLQFMIKNTSGGVMGAITWGAAFKMVAFTNPATGFSRSIDFTYDGASWIETGRCAADIPN